MRHRFEVGANRVPGHILAEGKAQSGLIALEGFAFQNIAQGHERHLIIGHLDADITMSRHGRLDADARRG